MPERPPHPVLTARAPGGKRPPPAGGGGGGGGAVARMAGRGTHVASADAPPERAASPTPCPLLPALARSRAPRLSGAGRLRPAAALPQQYKETVASKEA